MNELEQKLSSLPLAAPSEELDRRMTVAFADGRRTPQRSTRPLFWWWLAAFSLAGGMTALLVVSRNPSHAEPETIVYRLEPQGRMRDLLVGSPANRDGQELSVLNVNEP